MVEPDGRVLLPLRTIDRLWQPDRSLPAGLHVVRSADEWTRLLAQSGSGLSAVPPTLAVDWQSEMCVVVALGSRATGGYRVLIDLIEIVDDRMTVLAWEIRPGRHCMTSLFITHPFHAVAAPAHSGDARLVRRVAYENCGATEQ